MRTKTSLFLALLSVTTPAIALDVEPIQIKSTIGTPLLAEIPIFATSNELDQLQARLAAPVTFARIGLPRPQGSVAAMQFRIVRVDPDEAVIRITTSQPVTEEFITLLLQLDWQTGRMVREFSVSMLRAGESPTTVGIVAPVEPTSAPDAAFIPPIPLAGATDSANARIGPGPTPIAAEPVPVAQPIPLQSDRIARPRDVNGPSARKPAEPATIITRLHVDAKDAAATYGPVRRGETLSGIANRLTAPGQRVEQTIADLFAANPVAFAGGDMDLLLEGASLQLPENIAANVRNDRTEPAAILRPAAHESLPAPVEVVRARLQIARYATAFASAQASPGTMIPVSLRAAGNGPPDAEETASNALEMQYMKQRLDKLERLQDEQRKVITLQNEALAAAERQLAKRDREILLGSPWTWLLATGFLIVGTLIGLRLYQGKAKR